MKWHVRVAVPIAVGDGFNPSKGTETVEVEGDIQLEGGASPWVWIGSTLFSAYSVLRIERVREEK